MKKPPDCQSLKRCAWLGLTLALLGGTVWADEPALPAGLLGPLTETQTEPDESPGLEISGFWEARLGTRLQNDPLQRQASLAESRLHVRMDHFGDALDVRLAGDVLFDALTENRDLDLESGDGRVDLREASLSYRISSQADLRIGRQILTWGTGDLLFINDLFPKDFRSFFLGRDDEYLKAPSDAVKLSVFGSAMSLDIVLTPRFDADRYIDGRRLSFFDPAISARRGRRAPLRADPPDQWLDDAEWAARLYGQQSGVEWAAYAYRGFWKSPAGNDAGSGQAIFPALSVYGLSARGALSRGIAHIELGYYDSRDDRQGTKPLIANSQARLLIGYEQSVASETTLGVQYYLERRLKHAAYRRALPAGANAGDKNRHVMTTRLTHLALGQDLKTSLFAFYSPSDNDGYLKASANYRWDDHWSFEVGANWFTGRDDRSFFGQFDDNSNVYLASRYGFGT